MGERPRLLTLDVLRGFALLGILVINIQSFALPHAAYLNPRVFGAFEGLDALAWGVGRVLFDFKFLNLFATLFGASLVLGGEGTRPRRRLLWLVVFGLLHSYLVWYGDILFTYGVVGLVLLGARGWSIRRQVQVGLVLLAVGPALALAFAAAMPHLPTDLVRSVTQHLDASTVSGELTAYRAGWLAATPLRASIAWESQTTGLWLETGWRAAGFMLLGMAALRAGVFERGLGSRGALVGAWVGGLTLTGLGVALQLHTDFAPRAWVVASAVHEVGAVPLTFAIGATLLALARRFADAAPIRAVGTLGRMAFSVYIAQSVLGTWYFGGDDFGTFARTTLLVMPVGVWLAQIIVASVWARWLGAGPLERAWRALVRLELGGAR